MKGQLEVRDAAEEDILDDLFHSCALAAYLEQARHQQGPPCPDATRRLAYELYEQTLAEGRKSLLQPTD